jgi:glycerophosphoryl diester phosphodiesterase
MSGDFSVVGHRGWPNRFPENTIAGCIAAAEVADAIEVDVRRCGDGKLVLSHDPVLGGLLVAETPWAVLSEIDLGEGHAPALLDEVLASLPDTPLQIEVKNWPGDPGFEPDHRLALESAERSRPGDILTGFNPATLSAVRRHYPNVSTGLCIPAAVAFGDAVDLCVNAGHEVLVLEHSLITDDLNVPLQVFAWTVDDIGRARELVEWGVAGIITDDPGLISTLREHA